MDISSQQASQLMGQKLHRTDPAIGVPQAYAERLKAPVGFGDLFRVAYLLCSNSQGRAKLVSGESDTNPNPAAWAHEFVKLDQRRIGRDLLCYAQDLRHNRAGSVLDSFYDEIVGPIIRAAPGSLSSASYSLQNMAELLLQSEPDSLAKFMEKLKT